MKFKKYLAIFFAAFVLAKIAFPQVPPPAPLIFSTPTASELQKFNSGGSGFEAVFAGYPKKSTSRENKIFTESFTAKNKGLTTVVSIYRLTDPGERFENPEGFFEGVKSELLKPVDSKLVLEKPVSLDGFEAKEFVVSDSTGITKTRILVGKERVFEIAINVTNWSLLGEAKRKEFEDETERFYESFSANSTFDLSLIVGETTPETFDRRRGIEEIASFVGDEDEIGWREYKFDRIGASVSFPDEPTKETEPFDVGIFNAMMNSYSAKGNSQAYVFAEVNLGLTTESDEFRTDMYEGWQSGLAEAFAGAKLDRTDVDYAGKPARKIVGENDLLRFEAIGVFSGGRLFQLMAIAVKSGSDADVLKDNRAMAAKFFASFRLFPIINNTETGFIPPQNGKLITKEKFVNEEFGFSIDLPIGWVVINNDDIRESTERLIEDPSANSKGNATLTQSSERKKMLFLLLKPGSELSKSASFVCMVESIQSKDFDMKAIAEVAEENFVSNLGYEVYSPMKIVNINGTIFYRIWLRKYVNKLELNATIYMTKTNGKIIQFSISYVDDSHRELMENSLNTLKFEQVEK